MRRDGVGALVCKVRVAGTWIHVITWEERAEVVGMGWWFYGVTWGGWHVAPCAGAEGGGW